MLEILGSRSRLKLKTSPQKLMLTTFPFVTDSVFYPLSVHDMQLKTKQKIIPPNKSDMKVASSHIIVVFPRRLWLTSPGNNQNYVGSLWVSNPIKNNLSYLSVSANEEFCFESSWANALLHTHTKQSQWLRWNFKLLFTQVHVWAQQVESQHHSGLQ